MQISIEQVQILKDAASIVITFGAAYAGLAMKAALITLKADLTLQITGVKETLVAHNAETSAELREHKAEDKATFTAIKDSLERIERKQQR